MAHNTRKTPPRISQAAVVQATLLADQLLEWAADTTRPDPLRRQDPREEEEQ